MRINWFCAVIISAFLMSPAMAEQATPKPKPTKEQPNPEWVRSNPSDEGYKRGYAVCIGESFLPQYPGYRVPGWYKENWGLRVQGASFLFDAPVSDRLTNKRFIVIVGISPRTFEGGIQGRDEYGRWWWFSENPEDLDITVR